MKDGMQARELPTTSIGEAFPEWPRFDGDEVSAAERVLRSGRVNYWTGGEGRAFETEFAQSLSVPYGICLANGTVALELALMLVGVSASDEVVTSPRTFIASASAAVMRGAKPVFADVDRDSQNITAETIERVLTPRTRAIVLVHLAGWPCEMDPILQLAADRGIKVIEDCAQATGATYRKCPVGSLGDYGAFSFCQDKIITTAGEGGMLTLRDEAAWSRAWSFKDHGKSYAAVQRKHPPGFRWLHESFGTNWRLTEVQAAIGRLQLTKLPRWLERRRANAAQLFAAFSNLTALRVPQAPPHIGHAFYKFYAFLDQSALKSGWSRDRIVEEVTSRGVPCFSGSCSEVYLERAFDAPGLRPAERLPVARELGETSLMFLVHPTLGPQHMERTAETVRSVLRSAMR